MRNPVDAERESVKTKLLEFYERQQAKDDEYDYLFKVVLIGDSGVGKSCLLLRFAVRILDI